MKKICSITFPNGVKFEATENGFVLLSIEKDKTEFDSSGKLIRAVESKKNVKKNISYLQYFVAITQNERDIINEWLKNKKGKTPFERSFLKIVNIAMSKINYDYKIASIAPSIDIQGRLYYQKGIKACVGLSDFIWRKKAKEFAPEFESELASILELFMYYAYLIAKGEISIEYVCDEVQDEDGYFEKVVISESGIAWCGGDNQTYGEYSTIADIFYPKEDEGSNENGIGVVVLKKIN